MSNKGVNKDIERKHSLTKRFSDDPEFQEHRQLGLDNSEWTRLSVRRNTVEKLQSINIITTKGKHSYSDLDSDVKQELHDAVVRAGLNNREEVIEILKDSWSVDD